jgi:hypothetical protein
MNAPTTEILPFNDPDATATFAIADATATFAIPDATATFATPESRAGGALRLVHSPADEPDDPTEQMAALTLEQPLFDEPLPMPSSRLGEPAYFVEVRGPNQTATLLAVRASLDEAVFLAAGVHPCVADVTIRELALPCDAGSVLRPAAHARSWSRAPSGVWTPALPA